jgi:hypothetical protein
MQTGWSLRTCLLAGLLVLSLRTTDGTGPSSELWGAEEEQQPKTLTFTGTWNNRKTGATGPLKCVATETEPGKWKATFTGSFHNDPFSYEAEFQSRTVRRQISLGGTANIRGHDFQWTGTIVNGRLTARYQSSIRDFGGFVMREVKPGS